MPLLTTTLGAYPKPDALPIKDWFQVGHDSATYEDDVLRAWDRGQTPEAEALLDAATAEAVWFGFYGEAGYRAAYRKLMTEIDDERWTISTRLCQEIIEAGGYEGLDPRHVSDTLEGVYDGFCLNILMYPGQFSRQDAKARIRDYLARTFPRHIEASPGPACGG